MHAGGAVWAFVGALEMGGQYKLQEFHALHKLSTTGHAQLSNDGNIDSQRSDYRERRRCTQKSPMNCTKLTRATSTTITATITVVSKRW